MTILSQLIVTPYDGTQSIVKYLYDGIKWYFWDFHGYYWYMNFYFAFFLIIPFINTIINNINKKQHIFLIIISIVIISLPGFIAIVGDFCEPIKESGIRLPSYFSEDSFPFIYYFIGAYFRKYVKKVSVKQKYFISIFIIISLGIHSLCDWVYLHKYQGQFEYGQHVFSFNSYGNIFTIFSCSCFFLILTGIQIKNTYFNRFVIFLSSHTLEMYLGLIIADKTITRIADMFRFTVTCSVRGFIFWVFGEIIIIFTLATIYYIFRMFISNLLKATVKIKI